MMKFQVNCPVSLTLTRFYCSSKFSFFLVSFFGWTVARGYSDIPCMSGVFLADGPLKVQMFCI